MSMYITLPCTASKTEFPDNTRGKYTTLLSHELVLPGNYEAGICEVIIPVPRTCLKGDSEIRYGHRADLFINKFTVKKEDWDNLLSLVIPVDEKGKPYFGFSRENGKVQLNIPKGNFIEFLNGPLINIFKASLTTKYRENLTATIDITKFNIVYIYCDLCEYSIVGDSVVPCLRVIPLTPNAQTAICYDNVHYVPVDGSRFSTIEIIISDDLGKVVEFCEGITIVKLHVRPRK
jgi:hypothetical protein